MNRRNLIKCECNKCGTSYEVFYDTANEYYLCKECLSLEDEEEDEPKKGFLESHDLYNDEF
jgi:late competence protein required for DNA uptake (superfamily II DNA/RNA helicase)